MDGASALSLTRSSRVNDLFTWILLLCGPKTCFLFVCADNSTRQWSVNSTYINTTAGPLNITDICPGVEYLMKQNISILQVNVSDCENNLPERTAHQGVLYGVCDHFTTFCIMHVEGLRGMRVAAHVQRLAYWCDSRHWGIKIFKLYRYSRYKLQCDHHTLSEMVILSHTNRMHMLHTNIPLIKVSVLAFTHPRFFGKHIQEYSGYVLIAPTIYIPYPFVQKWEISSRHAVMVSIHHLTKLKRCIDCGHIILAYSKQNTIYQTREKVYIWRPTLAKIIFTYYLKIVCRSTDGCGEGLKIYVSVLSIYIQHLMLPGGFFNCSVNYYSKLQHHLDCNLKTECEDGRDETELCSFSNSDCRGLVASRNKCFTLVVFDNAVMYTLLNYECMKVNGKLASVKSRKEQEDFLHVVKNYSEFNVAVGFTSGWHSVPFMYRMFHTWSDNTLVYNMNHFRIATLKVVPRNFEIMSIYLMALIKTYTYMFISALCEIELQSHGVNHFLVPLAYLRLPTPSFTYTNQLLLVCPDSHVTHVFLPCDSNCTTAMHLTSCTATNVSDARQTDMYILQRRLAHTYVVFKCDDGILTVHHTFVCDFRQDCPDGTDESFCEHPSCTGLLCSNCQCVSFSQWLNRYSDCVDDSDEASLSPSWAEIKEIQQQRFYVNLDGTGYFTQQALTADESCPHSHYQCTTEWLNCLPIYTRCNGFFDCVYGEDEQDCEMMTCAGFYQCRTSIVCVHRDHLCDGWGQCPQRDDELVCDMTCPEGCLCQGHAFLCNKPFPSDLFPQLRCMDSTGTHMSLADFNKNPYLVHLTLSQCSLYNISGTKLLNLRYINLTNNYLGTLEMSVFIELPNLRSIHLENNPLNNIKRGETKHVHYALRQVDVSKTHVGILHSELFIYFPCVKILNISFCDIEAIGPIGFKNVPQLRELDISGNTVIIFPFDLLSSLYHLERISSSNYRLCCRSLLPKRSGKINCFAPNTVLPSCTELMPTELYRIFFWLTGICSVTGNLVCFITSLAVNKVFGSHFLIYIINMQLANICMGSHTIIVLVADYIFHGKYIQTEKTWTNSVACKLAGFLFLLSSAVSVLIIWFITVYHVIALYVFLNVRRLNKCLTSTVCAVMWVVGILLASVPFLPELSHWGLQVQSGLCRLALFDSYNSSLDFGWFTVIVAVNFILCLMIVAGQTIIYRRTPKNRITLHPTQRLMYSSVHVMGKVSVTDAVCWFAFGLVTMMSSHVVGGLDKLHDTMVVFVLPFSSALNPLLYMWAVRTQWQRQGLEERILQALKSQLAKTGKIKTSTQ